MHKLVDKIYLPFHTCGKLTVWGRAVTKIFVNNDQYHPVTVIIVSKNTKESIIDKEIYEFVCRTF